MQKLTGKRERAMKSERKRSGQAKALLEIDVDQYVSDLYEIILKRPADKAGLSGKVKQLITGKRSAAEVAGEMLASPEAKARMFHALWHGRTANYRLEIDTHRSTIEELSEITAAYWRKAGFDRAEVYFSVLSASEWKKDPSAQDIKRFYASGNGFIQFCLARLEEQGIGSVAEMSCLDFGCGVGRLSLPASKHFKKVYAVDFSPGHLALLEENKERFPNLSGGEIECIDLKKVIDAERLPRGLDFVFSFISLQHNTPPVIAFLLEQLLGTLKSGGFACLHIPIHHPFYNFSVDEYRKADKSGQHMELHILPRENIRDIAQAVGAEIRDSFGFGGTKGVYSEVFLFRKN